MERAGWTLQKGFEHVNKGLKASGSQPRGETFQTEIVVTRSGGRNREAGRDGAMRGQETGQRIRETTSQSGKGPWLRVD